MTKDTLILSASQIASGMAAVAFSRGPLVGETAKEIAQQAVKIAEEIEKEVQKATPTEWK